MAVCCFQETLLSTILFFKRKQKKEIEKDHLKCQALDVLTYQKTCRLGYKQLDKHAIAFVPGGTEIESHFFGCGDIFLKV